MKKLISSFAVLTLLVAANAYAGVWNPSVHISEIEVNSDVAGAGSRAFLILQEGAASKPACGAATPYVQLQGTTENIRNLIGIATTAFINSRPVGVFFDGTCTGPYANVAGLALR
ncbi:hypothetical protein Geob_1140 [Geotalea daltonii FRC-32]|uniref:Uncharacterized protein n=1 Tax=Geotalea daltonii (strain DSM 22248 / JCM 15807 / FRC-32) TaxID=316067 RepID=B9M390_GEODF|nr:hypothetical protein [Geotalea daltonii]ACM19500.1 hypothetical protein Geob_1140 [Geotalea daltonii FRC-32]